MERFAKIVQVEKLLTIFTKRSILVLWQGSEYPPGCWNLFFTYFFSKSWWKRSFVLTTHQAFSSLLVVERSYINSLTLSLLCSESGMFLKENPEQWHILIFFAEANFSRGFGGSKDIELWNHLLLIKIYPP